MRTHKKERLIDASAEQVWDCWTTTLGADSFFAQQAWDIVLDRLKQRFLEGPVDWKNL
ncbi:hypothetical protein ISS30_08290 [bacterium]|nr:hypothetical protein [bacterium]